MYYVIRYHTNDDPEREYEVPLWTETVNYVGFNAEDPHKFCKTREDAIKVFKSLKRDPFFHHLKLFESESNTDFNAYFGTDITQMAYNA